MPTYSYTLKQKAELVKGTVRAGTHAEALNKVRRQDGIVLEMKEIKEKKDLLGAIFNKPVLNLKERIIFTEQVSVMLTAGIALPQVLRSLEEEAARTGLKQLYGALADELEAGTAFSQVLMKQPKSFSTVYCHMVQSSEKSGNLSDILMKLTEQQRKEYELKGKVRGALMYPMVISILLIAVVIMVIVFVLPRLNGLFESSGVTLPLSTRLLLGLSTVFTKDWYVLLIAVVGIFFGMRYVGRTEKGRIFFDTAKLKIPVLGGFIRKAAIARFAQTFSFLAQAGVPVLDIFKTLRGVMGNSVYEKEIDRIEKEVANGIPLSVSIRKSKNFPAMVGQLVRVGEQSGDLAGMFTVLGNFFEKEVDEMAKNLSSLLEPIIMIIMGVVIGFVLISIIQPIYGLVNAV